MFHPPKSSQVQHLQNAVAWKVIPFKTNGSATVTFRGLYGVGAATVGSGNIVSTSTWQAFKVCAESFLRLLKRIVDRDLDRRAFVVQGRRLFHGSARRPVA
jgi:hypothetical protein